VSTFVWDQPVGYEVGVGICHREVTTIEWALAFRQLQLPSHIFILSSHFPIDLSRNSLANTILQHNCKWIFMLDTDVCPPPDAVMRLLSRNMPIVSGLYWMKQPPYAPVAMRRVPQPQPDGSVKMALSPVAGWVPGELLEVDVVGMGCCLIHSRVLRAFQEKGMPYFRWTFAKPDKPPDVEGMSEDFNFCTDAKKLGFNTYLDTGVVCGHQGIGVVREGALKISDIP